MKYREAITYLEGTFNDIWPIITALDTIPLVEKLIEYENTHAQRESVLSRLRSRYRKLTRKKMNEELYKEQPR